MARTHEEVWLTIPLTAHHTLHTAGVQWQKIFVSHNSVRMQAECLMPQTCYKAQNTYCLFGGVWEPIPPPQQASKLSSNHNPYVSICSLSLCIPMESFLAGPRLIRCLMVTGGAWNYWDGLGFVCAGTHTGCVCYHQGTGRLLSLITHYPAVPSINAVHSESNKLLVSSKVIRFWFRTNCGQRCVFALNTATSTDWVIPSAWYVVSSTSKS